MTVNLRSRSTSHRSTQPGRGLPDEGASRVGLLRPQAAGVNAPTCCRCSTLHSSSRVCGSAPVGPLALTRCNGCIRRDAERMAGEMGNAVAGLFPCAFLGQCEGKPPGKLRECSMQPHHVIYFAKWAWKYALEAERAAC